MWVRKNRPWLIAAIFILTILLIVSLIYLPADKTKLSTQEFANELTFCGTIGSLLAVALSLVAIGISVKDADIDIFLPPRDITNAGILQQVRIRNLGNALGTMAHAFIEVHVSPTSPVSFAPAQGLNFEQTPNQALKQYRLDIPEEPRNIYPGEFIWSLLGFVQAPLEFHGQVKFSVQVVGVQGRKQKEFTLDIK